MVNSLQRPDNDILEYIHNHSKLYTGEEFASVVYKDPITQKEFIVPENIPSEMCEKISNCIIFRINSLSDYVLKM